MAANHKIAGVGEVLWDAFPEGEEFGGAPANFACHCASLCSDAHVVSRVGGDSRGRRALTHGIDLAGLSVDPEVVLVTVDRDGHPQYEIAVLKLNDAELPVVAFGIEGPDEEILKGLFQACGLSLIALTRGERGSMTVSEKETSITAAPQVEVVNTVGAGDSFTTATIVGLLEGKPLDKINEHATHLAAYVCTQPGAVPTPC